MLGVNLGRVLVVIGGMQGMPVRDLGMVRGLFVIAGPVVLRGLAMVLGRILMVLRCHLVMLVNVVRAHRRLLGGLVDLQDSRKR
jgi:hypothetical protein